MTNLPHLRIALATAKDALREQKADHETMRALREQYAIDCGALAACKNEAERTRALLIALDQDNDYIAARDQLRSAEYEVERLAAEIAVEEDARRADELRIREASTAALDRYATALMRANPVQAAIDSMARPF